MNMNTAFVSKLGKRGQFVIPAEFRVKFSLKEGDLLITEESPDGLLLRPAVALPIETYTAERKAEFLLTNSLSQEEYETAQQTVKAMGLDPKKIQHYSPYQHG